MTIRLTVRYAALSFILCALAPLLMSCADTEQIKPISKTTPEPIAHINFLASEYSSETRALLEGLVQDFMLKNPNIIIDLQVANWDILDNIYTTRISKNQPPDLLNTNVFSHFAYDGLLNDFNDILTPEFKSKFYPDLLQLDQYEGKQYGIPYVSTNRKLYYNQELFREAGISTPPTTWSELKRDAAKIKKTGKAHGFGVDLSDNEIQAYLSYFFLGAGGGWMKDSKWTINSPQNIDGLTFLKNMYNAGLSDPEPTVTTRDEKQRIVGDGKLGMMISGNYFSSVMPREFPGLQFGSGPIPVKDGVTPINFGVHDMLISFKTDHTNKEAISKFLEYLYSNSVYTEIVSREGFLPVTKEVGTQMSAADYRVAANLTDLRNAQFYPVQQPEWQSIMDTARKMGDAVLHDHVSPKEALDKLQQFAEEKRLENLHKK